MDTLALLLWDWTNCKIVTLLCVKHVNMDDKLASLMVLPLPLRTLQPPEVSKKASQFQACGAIVINVCQYIEADCFILPGQSPLKTNTVELQSLLMEPLDIFMLHVTKSLSMPLIPLTPNMNGNAMPMKWV